MMRRIVVRGSLALVVLLTVLRVGAFGQTGSIAGVVKDTTGAVMPGVTVEATSPALIERVRSVTTDDKGQYKIIDTAATSEWLRPTDVLQGRLVKIGGQITF